MKGDEGGDRLRGGGELKAEDSGMNRGRRRKGKVQEEGMEGDMEEVEEERRAAWTYRRGRRCKL